MSPSALALKADSSLTLAMLTCGAVGVCMPPTGSSCLIACAAMRSFAEATKDFH